MDVVKLRIFILEDEIDEYRSPIKTILKDHDLTIARSFEDAVEKYSGPYDVMLLDHDMNGQFTSSHEPNTGFQFVKWLVEKENGVETDPLVVCHSQNPDGRKNMWSLLDQEGYRVEQLPYGPKLLAALRNIV